MSDTCPKCGCSERLEKPAYSFADFQWKCGSGECAGEFIQGWTCLYSQVAKYKKKADTFDQLLLLIQSFEGVDADDLSKADAYIAAWQKQNDQLATVTAERDQLEQRVRELSDRFSMLIGYVATCRHENTSQWLDRLQSVLNTCLATLGDPDRIQRAGYGFEIVKHQEAAQAGE